MKILGIETSCDETSAAVVEDGCRVLSNQIASQIEIHARYGGVVPEVASRQHILAIIPVIEQALIEAAISWGDIDGIAVTNGPGLAGSLLVGVNAAKAISFSKNIPLNGINHLEGHIYANWLAAQRTPEFPLMCLIVSGGHSDLVLMRSHGHYTVLARTRDDAAGESFDKAARALGLSYPGGPAIQKASKDGNAGNFKLPRPVINDSDDFSFSGLKTALMRLVEKGMVTSVSDAAASFQNIVVDMLVSKTLELAARYQVKQILLAGGVASNKALRERIKEKATIPVIIPEPVFCTDNAAMIAACGYFRRQSGIVDSLDLDVIPNLKLA